MKSLPTKYLSLHNLHLAYCEHGAGHPLILLHGNSESKHIFTRYQLEYFSMFHTFALDSRGHGESQSTDDAYTIAGYADDVIEFCKLKGITTAFVIGYSDGGNIALHLAGKAPALFPRLVAISPNTLADGTEPGTLRLFRRLHSLMSFLAHLGFNTKKFVMRLNLMLTDIGLSDDDLRRIGTNMMVIYAEKDLIKEDHIRHIAGLIPNATVYRIPACNHMNVYKQPETIQLMKSYLLAE